MPEHAAEPSPSAAAEIGIIGGSGLYRFLDYRFLDDAREVRVSTPFGLPSDPLVLGELAGRRVAFLPRHGVDHRFPPHRVPYRANLRALRSVGARRTGWEPIDGGTLCVIEGSDSQAWPSPSDTPRPAGTWWG